MSKHNSSRRVFLRRAAVGAGTVAGAGIVSEAFAQSHEQDPKSRPETNGASHPRSNSEGLGAFFNRGLPLFRHQSRHGSLGNLKPELQ
jgi:hypothetical protein